MLNVERSHTIVYDETCMLLYSEIAIWLLTYVVGYHDNLRGIYSTTMCGESGVIHDNTPQLDVRPYIEQEDTDDIVARLT